MSNIEKNGTRQPNFTPERNQCNCLGVVGEGRVHEELRDVEDEKGGEDEGGEEGAAAEVVAGGARERGHAGAEDEGHLAGGLDVRLGAHEAELGDEGAAPQRGVEVERVAGERGGEARGRQVGGREPLAARVQQGPERFAHGCGPPWR